MVKHNGYTEDSLTLKEDVLRKFYTKNGWLTRYALACGYIEKAEIGTATASLWMEHGVLHVRLHDTDYEKTERNFWESYPTLSAARKKFRNAMA